MSKPFFFVVAATAIFGIGGYLSQNTWLPDHYSPERVVYQRPGEDVANPPMKLQDAAFQNAVQGLADSQYVRIGVIATAEGDEWRPWQELWAKYWRVEDLWANRPRDFILVLIQREREDPSRALVSFRLYGTARSRAPLFIQHTYEFPVTSVRQQTWYLLQRLTQEMAVTQKASTNDNPLVYIITFGLLGILSLLVYVSWTGHLPELSAKPTISSEQETILLQVRKWREKLLTIEGFIQRKLSINISSKTDWEYLRLQHPALGPALNALEIEIEDFSTLFNQLTERLDFIENQAVGQRVDKARALLAEELMPQVDVSYRVPGRGVSAHSLLTELDERARNICSQASNLFNSSSDKLLP